MSQINTQIVQCPKISVIVPVYNVEKYIHNCINSILSQTYTDFELLLINDGSTDNSGVICDQYAELDARIRVLNHENKGVSFTRNRGVLEGVGEWITFVDSDDYLSPDMFMFFFKNITTNIDIVSCDFFLETHTKLHYCKQPLESRDLNLNRLLNGNLHGSLCWKLFKKDLLLKNEIFLCENIRMMEDKLMMFNLLSLNPQVVHIPQALYYYVVHENSAVSKSHIKYIDDIHFVYNMIYDKLNQNKDWIKMENSYYGGIISIKLWILKRNKKLKEIDSFASESILLRNIYKAECSMVKKIIYYIFSRLKKIIYN